MWVEFYLGFNKYLQAVEFVESCQPYALIKNQFLG